MKNKITTQRKFMFAALVVFALAISVAAQTVTDFRGGVESVLMSD